MKEMKQVEGGACIGCEAPSIGLIANIALAPSSLGTSLLLMPIAVLSVQDSCFN